MYVAVNVVVPTLTPATSPVFETVAVVTSATCQVANDVTVSTVALFASRTVAEYCDVAPTDGGVPLIDSDVTVADGSVGVLVQPALIMRTAAAVQKTIEGARTPQVDDVLE